MRKFILATIFFVPCIAQAATVGDLTVAGSVIGERIDISTYGGIVQMGFIDGSSQTTAGFVRGKDESGYIMATSTIDCVGAGITCSDQGSGVFRLSVSGGGNDSFGNPTSTRPITATSGIDASSAVVVSSLNVMGVITSSTGFITTSSTFNFVSISTIIGTSSGTFHTLTASSFSVVGGTLVLNGVATVWHRTPPTTGQIPKLNANGHITWSADDTTAGGGGEVFGYISTRNVDMNDFGIANSTGLELGNFLQITTYLSTNTADLDTLRSSITFIRESTGTFNTRFNTFSSTTQAELGTFKGWFSTNSTSINVLISTLMAVRTDTSTFRSVFNTFTSTTQTHISTNLPTDIGRPAIIRASTGTSNGPSFVFWDVPQPREFSWSGASLLAISTNNSPNIAPVVKTTGTKSSEVLGAAFDDSLEECRGASFKVPRYCDLHSTPTFSATWFPSNKSGATGDVLFDVRFSSSISSGNSWDVVRTTYAAPASAGLAGANRVSEITWQPSGTGGSAGNNGGISGHGTLSSMGLVPGGVTFFNVCRNGGATADDLVGDAVLLDFTISIPMR